MNSTTRSTDNALTAFTAMALFSVLISVIADVTISIIAIAIAIIVLLIVVTVLGRIEAV